MSAVTFSQPLADDTAQRLAYKLALLLGVSNPRMDDTIQRLLYRIAVHIGAANPRMDDMSQRLAWKIAVKLGVTDATIQDMEQRLLWKISQHYGVSGGCCDGLGDNSQRLLFETATALAEVPPTPPPVAPDKAASPDPANGAPSVDPSSVTLSWAASSGATSYDVWFDGVFQGNQPGTSFLAGALSSGTGYTWRIDSVNSAGTTTGDTWTFTTAASYHPQVLDWVSRVTGAGGADPSSGTKQALSDFMDALDTATLTSRIIALNCFVPDSLIACCVPLIANAGLPVWTNNNFVAGDLSVNGLTGSLSAPNKYLSTGLRPDVDWPIDPNFGVPDVGISVCLSDFAQGAGDHYIFRELDGIGLEWSFLWFGSGSNKATAGDPLNSILSGMPENGSPGFIGMNIFTDYSIPALAFRCYLGQSGFHSQIGELLNAGIPPFPGEAPTGLTDLPLYITNNNGVYQNPTDIRISFAAFHEGWLEADSAQLYAAFRTMRLALGGGAV